MLQPEVRGVLLKNQRRSIPAAEACAQQSASQENGFF
jgi:hypothetical protein